ncbi:MAG: KilA-N domain-containing protein, partial [Bacteroidota bacterium]
MVNATQMAKPFKGKLVADFLRLKTTKEYILLLEERYGDSHIADSQPN